SVEKVEAGLRPVVEGGMMRAIVVWISGLVAASAWAAEAPTPTPGLDDFAWLAGHWVGEGPGSVRGRPHHLGQGWRHAAGALRLPAGGGRERFGTQPFRASRRIARPPQSTVIPTRTPAANCGGTKLNSVRPAAPVAT